MHVKAIIIVSGNELSIEQIEKCKTNKINVIKTNLESLKTARRVINSEYIKNVMNNIVGIASSGVVVNQWFNLNVKWLILSYHS